MVKTFSLSTRTLHRESYCAAGCPDCVGYSDCRERAGSSLLSELGVVLTYVLQSDPHLMCKYQMFWDTCRESVREGTSDRIFHNSLSSCCFGNKLQVMGVVDSSYSD